MISKRYGDTILYWGHRVLVRYTDGTDAEGILAPDARGVPCLDGSPLDPARVAELRMIGVCTGPADRDGTFLLRSIIHGRGAYRFPADDPGAALFLDRLRDGAFLCEADAVLSLTGEGDSLSITAGDLHLRSLRPQVRSGDAVSCTTEDGTGREGLVLAVLDDGFVLAPGSDPGAAPELVSFDELRDFRLAEKRQSAAAAEDPSPAFSGGRERTGLLLFSENGSGFIGSSVQNASGRWLVPSPDAFFRADGKYAFDQEQRIYAVRYTLPDPAAEGSAPGARPLARAVRPLVGNSGRPLSFLKRSVSEVFVAEAGQSVPDDWLHEEVRSGEDAFVAVRSRYPYDPRYMAGELTDKPVFARVGVTGELVCGRLKGASPQGITIATHTEKDGRQISFSDLTELRAFGHITALTGNGGTIDGRFRFRAEDLHSDWDRDTSRLKPGAAMCFRLARPASARGFVLDDVMCMEESEEIRYAAACVSGEEKTFRFGKDPQFLCGEEDSRDFWFPWDPGAVYEVLVCRASGREYPEAEWVDSYARFVPEGVKDLRCRSLAPLTGGKEYAIAWRNPSDRSVTLCRLFYANTKRFPSRLIARKAASERWTSFSVPQASLGQAGGSNRIALEMFQTSKRQTLSAHRFLVSYLPRGEDGIEPGSLEVLQAFKYPALAGLRYREDGTASSLVLCTDDSPAQSRPYLLSWAFSRTETGSFSKEAAAFRSIRADNVNDARAMLDRENVSGMDGLRLAAAAKLRFMIWNQTSDWDDRNRLRALLSPALNVIARIRGQGRSLEQQEWARFLYMLSLRVDPKSQNACTGFFSSLAFQQDSRRFASLSRLGTLREVTAAIADARVSGRFYDAMTAGSMMLFVPMPFEDRDSADSFREFVDPEAGRKTMAAVLSGMDSRFLQQYRSSLKRLLPEPSDGTTEDLIRQAVDQCNAFRDFFAEAYTPNQYEDELDRRLSDPRSGLLLSLKNNVTGQFRTLLEHMHDTSDYDIFLRRKACFDRAAAARKRLMDLYQYTCLFQYLYLPVARHAGSRLSYAMKKFADYSRPVLALGGCDVIGVRDGLLHLRVSITYPETSPMRQNAENVSLRLQPSEEYDILPNEEKGVTPPTERSVFNTSVKDLAVFDLPKLPAGRSETGIDFLVRPRDPETGRWTLKASLAYGWAWSPDPKAILDVPGGHDSDMTAQAELSFARPGSSASLDRRRVGLFQAKFDNRVAKRIRELEAADPSDPQIPALRSILLNRRKDVEDIAEAFCDPAFPDSLAEDARLVILQGQWRVGKSTVLSRIGPRIREIDPSAVVVLMDLPFVNRNDETVSTFSRSFAHSFVLACDRAGVSLIPDGDPEDRILEFGECRRLLSRWMKAHPDKRILLLLDEFTHLYADMRSGLASRQDLKELVTFLISEEWRLLTVAVGGEFTSRMLELLDGNTIQKTPKIVDLQYLDEIRVRDFARFVIGEDRFAGDGSGGSEAALHRLYELTRGNMFLLQEFCTDLIRCSEEDAKKRAAAGAAWDEDLVFTNRWIDRTIRRVASSMTELEKKHRFDFLWNPFNEDENGGDVSSPDTVSLLNNERVFEDYRSIFRGIIQVADGDTHTFQRDALKQFLTEGEFPVMTPEIFEERFLALAETRRVIEHVNNSDLCYRIPVDLCFILLYLSK